MQLCIDECSAQKLDTKAGYANWQKTVADADLVQHLAIFMSMSARLKQPDMTFDAGYSAFKNVFPEVLSQSLQSRGVHDPYKLWHVRNSWSKAQDLPVAQGEDVHCVQIDITVCMAVYAHSRYLSALLAFHKLINEIGS